MADSTPAVEPGAPIARDWVDPEMVKLKRPRAKIGIVTAAGVVFLCVMFLLRLNADRRFAGHGEPQKVTVEQILAGDVGNDSYVTVEAEPLMSHAIRTSIQKGGLGLRVAPARGTDERLWVVLPGNGWEQPTTKGYTGRLRPLSALPFAKAVGDFAEANPRPMFATAAAARAGFAGGKVQSVSGETLALADGDQVALDVVDPDAATIVATLNERLPSADVWRTKLTEAGLQPGAPIASPAGVADQVRFEIKGPGAVASTTTKLEAADLWAARVEPVTRHYATTWGALKASGAAGFTVAQGVTLPDAQIDLLGLYVAKGIPDGAYALIDGERPADYWHVLPISIVLVAIGALFLWALVRAIKRDLLPTPTPTSAQS